MEKIIYHYTTTEHLAEILNSGMLKVSNPIEKVKCKKPTLWLSLNSVWEPTANKIGEFIRGEFMRISKEELHNYRPLIRFSVPFDKNSLWTWADYKYTKSISDEEYEEMERIGREQGADSNEWYASFKNINLTDCLKCEIWNGNNWVVHVDFQLLKSLEANVVVPEYSDELENYMNEEMAKIEQPTFSDEIRIRDRFFRMYYADKATPIPQFVTKEIMDEILCSQLVSSFSRFEVFYDITKEKDMAPSTFWYGLSEAYQCSDDLFNYREQVRECFSSNLPDREHLMTPEEQLFLQQLPENVRIYRAMTQEEADSKNYNISWTLSESQAIFFRDVYIRNYSTNGKKRTIVSLVVPKEKLIAYFGDREEEEVIYLG